MAKTYRNLEDRDAMQEKELSGAMVADITSDELEKILSARADGQRHGDRIRHRQLLMPSSLSSVIDLRRGPSVVITSIYFISEFLLIMNRLKTANA